MRLLTSICAAGVVLVLAAAPAGTTAEQGAQAPAARTPAMTLPATKPAVTKPGAVVKEAPDAAKGRTPTRGEKEMPGSAVAETGARGQGFGLSTSGGAEGASGLIVVQSR